MISYLLYYVGDFIEKHPRLYNRLATVLTQQGSRNPLVELKALDNCLNAHYFDNPVSETICPDRVRPRENLKLWAKLTVEALAYDSRFTIIEHKPNEDEAIARVFCHWDAMLRGVTLVQLHDGYNEEQRTQDILGVYEVLGHDNFCNRIQDPYNNLGKQAKHAVASPPSATDTIGLHLLGQSHGYDNISRYRYRKSIPRRNPAKSPPDDLRRSPIYTTPYPTSDISFPNRHSCPRRDEMA